MMWKEFEDLAGYEVTFEDYNNIIEPMYMALPDHFTKQDFVKMIDKKRFAIPPKKTQKQLINLIKKEAAHLYDICGHHADYEAEYRIQDYQRELEKRFGGYWYIIPGYEYPELMRGCTYPKTLIWSGDHKELKRFELIKSDVPGL